jgi:hypothetical protein
LPSVATPATSGDAMSAKSISRIETAVAAAIGVEFSQGSGRKRPLTVVNWPADDYVAIGLSHERVDGAIHSRAGSKERSTSPGAAGTRGRRRTSQESR